MEWAPPFQDGEWVDRRWAASPRFRNNVCLLFCIFGFLECFFFVSLSNSDVLHCAAVGDRPDATTLLNCAEEGEEVYQQTRHIFSFLRVVFDVVSGNHDEWRVLNSVQTSN